MSLREGLIEIVADELGDLEGEYGRATALAAAADVLNAVLDYLTEHAVDWSEAGSIFHDANVYQLLAALRVRADTGVT